MGTVEYRVEYVSFDNAPDAESQSAQLVERLDEFGRDGWRVANVDSTRIRGWPSYTAGPSRP